MLAERFLPPAIFDHIASGSATSADGLCEELNTLEEAAKGPPGRSKNTDSELGSTVEDWLTRTDVVRWASIEPKLGKEDLRPYLFVINDVKSYSEAESPLSQKLVSLLEKISAGEMSARGASAELKQLDPKEVDSIIRELRMRVLSSPSFATRPLALFGLAEAVKAHPAFELRYIEVLEELPASELAAWAATGHQSYLSDQSKPRLEALLTRWRTEGGTLLKATLETGSQLKPKRKG
jgi:hypothetical protein